jgi:hypothetical protein
MAAPPRRSSYDESALGAVVGLEGGLDGGPVPLTLPLDCRPEGTEERRLVGWGLCCTGGGVCVDGDGAGDADGEALGGVEKEGGREEFAKEDEVWGGGGRDTAARGGALEVV